MSSWNKSLSRDVFQNQMICALKNLVTLRNRKYDLEFPIEIKERMVSNRALVRYGYVHY